MIAKIRYAFLSLITAFFLYEATTAGFGEDFAKGCYYLLWMNVTMNLSMIDSLEDIEIDDEERS